MEPPRVPLTALNRLNLQLPNTIPSDSLKERPASDPTPTSNPPKQTQVKRYIAPELINEFKAAVQGSDLTKLGLTEVLKKQYVLICLLAFIEGLLTHRVIRFPKQSKSAIQDTLMLLAERVGPRESEKRWILKDGSKSAL